MEIHKKEMMKIKNLKKGSVTKFKYIKLLINER